MRALSIAVEQALAGRELRCALLAEITLPDLTVHRFWSGAGTLFYDGNNWTGLGRLGQISGAGETSEIRTVETAYTLAGVSDFAALNEFLETSIRNGTAMAWLAMLDDNEQVIPDPVRIDHSVLDRAAPRFGADGTAALTLMATSAVFNFSRSPDLFVTHEQQQKDFPGDTGFNRIPGLAARAVQWTPA